jgi:HAD superfamily hydrolase (TIGR01459 family)
MDILQHFSTIAPEYDGFILDVWGVLHDGVQAFDGAVACVDLLHQLRKEIVIVSNAPRPADQILPTLQGMGFNLRLSQIITSGEVVKRQVFERRDPIFAQRGTKAFHLGAKHHPLVASAPQDVGFVDTLENADYILATIFFPSDTPVDHFDDVLTQAQALHLPLVCANPDKIAPAGQGFHYCAGTIAERYLDMGGEVIFFGKPYPAIYQVALEKFTQAGIQTPKILAVGDTLETDILGAAQQGIHAALVLTGIEGRRLGGGGATADQVAALCAEQKMPLPTWVVPAFKF